MLYVLACALLAGCAATAPVDGPLGPRPGVPTLEISGTVDPAIELTLHVEYVATGTGRRCTRIDGESGRVVSTRWLRYEVPIREQRYAVPIALDPLDDSECSYVPRTLYFQARNAQTGKTMDGYASLLGFTDDAGDDRARLEPQFIDCQDAFDGGRTFDCSLPRTPLNDGGPLCTVERTLSCANDCSAEFNFRRVAPPRRDALWAVPQGCPATPTDRP